MPTVLLQGQLFPSEIKQLKQEFLRYDFFDLNDLPIEELPAAARQSTEIYYGQQLPKDALEQLSALHWIHIPSPSLQGVPLDEIYRRGSLLLTNTLGSSVQQVAEYAMGGLLYFAKNISLWQGMKRDNKEKIWKSPHRESIWTLENKIFLQVGLARLGTEITKKANDWGMRIWGVQEKKTFHPHCQKTFSKDELQHVLPLSDIVSVCLPRRRKYHHWFKEEQFNLMKSGSILIVLGHGSAIDEAALVLAAETGKFRGIVIDAFEKAPLPSNSPLWNLPNTLISPEVAFLPYDTQKRTSFRLFRHNMRQFVRGNYTDMKNVISRLDET
ncbi:D-2-hydroxyacid dehydrogenase [Simkania negevensis]|uniref:D-2-hydroxyacid dehydrogenase n=1 Tax=Simkania negevensis TaxID=83561 RepID=A0ABS3AQ71_9BACT|nr:D-2-hydroxyacid dehydrogenase [Simkania negevensis]